MTRQEPRILACLPGPFPWGSKASQWRLDQCLSGAGGSLPPLGPYSLKPPTLLYQFILAVASRRNPIALAEAVREPGLRELHGEGESG